MAKKPPSPDPHVASQTRAAWIATLLAVIALIVSVFSLYEAREARLSAVRDEVLLRATRPMGDQPISIRKTPSVRRFGTVSVPWDLLISNTGNSTVSIVEYEVLQIAGGGGEVMYSGLNGGLFKPEDRQPVSLPVALEAGKSIRLVAVVGLSPGDKAYRVIAETIAGERSTVSLSSVEKLLASNLIDIYDNPVALLGSSGEVSGWRVEKTGNEQVFLFKVRTARGSEINGVSSWYDFRR